MASRPDRPLPSAKDDEEEEAGEEEEDEEEPEEAETEEEEAPTKAAPPAPSPGGSRPPGRTLPPPVSPWKSLERFLLIFMGFMGIYMLFDTSARNAVAADIGSLLSPVLGFDGKHVLLTMFLTGVLQMAITAVAYHFTTDWVETARVQKHNQAIRPLYSQAIRSGKKNRVEALKPHMNELQMRQTKVTFSQMKGMVVTWVLIIAIYTWMGLFISSLPVPDQYVNMFGSHVSLLAPLGPVPLWFLVFSLYTLPLNLLFRRYLKHVALTRHLQTLEAPVAAPAEGTA
ncbi:hypothetical protein B1B_03135 [mine drainage metagenome]|uniref:DUF106 domain-containing protein n=1 Tax=mine drainage metagenome TaxID=410659 RepID=T1BKY5_9ZZZZ